MVSVTASVQPNVTSSGVSGIQPNVTPYTPESSNISNTNNKNVSNHYNPQFVLNMNGASATDSNKQKVKQWIKESMEEMFASMERTNPQLYEV